MPKKTKIEIEKKKKGYGEKKKNRRCRENWSRGKKIIKKRKAKKFWIWLATNNQLQMKFRQRKLRQSYKKLIQNKNY